MFQYKIYFINICFVFKTNDLSNSLRIYETNDYFQESTFLLFRRDQQTEAALNGEYGT